MSYSVKVVNGKYKSRASSTRRSRPSRSGTKRASSWASTTRDASCTSTRTAARRRSSRGSARAAHAPRAATTRSARSATSPSSCPSASTARTAWSGTSRSISPTSPNKTAHIYSFMVCERSGAFNTLREADPLHQRRVRRRHDDPDELPARQEERPRSA